MIGYAVGLCFCFCGWFFLCIHAMTIKSPTTTATSEIITISWIGSSGVTWLPLWFAGSLGVELSVGAGDEGGVDDEFESGDGDEEEEAVGEEPDGDVGEGIIVINGASGVGAVK